MSIKTCVIRVYYQKDHSSPLVPLYSSDMTINDQAKPIRIQRKRSKGWRMPPNTVYVGRPTKWGNYCLEQGANIKRLVELFEIYATHRARNDPRWLAPLKGKNLACWCKPGDICHADILLKLANQGDL